jgi:hypothetical protein
MVFTATYIEICDDPTWVCTNPKCCAGSLWFYDKTGTTIGSVKKDASEDMEATASCVCSIGTDNSCLLTVNVKCDKGPAGAFYNVAEFGRAFDCKKCQ